MRLSRDIKTKIRGTTFRPVDFQTIRLGDALELRREPDNPADPNAVRFVHKGRHIGYLSRQLAAEVAPAIDAGVSANAIVDHITGGVEGAENLGINVTVTLADDLNEAMFCAPASAS